MKTRMIPSEDYPNSMCYHDICIFVISVFLLISYIIFLKIITIYTAYETNSGSKNFLKFYY